MDPFRFKLCGAVLPFYFVFLLGGQKQHYLWQIRFLFLVSPSSSYMLKTFFYIFFSMFCIVFKFSLASINVFVILCLANNQKLTLIANLWLLQVFSLAFNQKLDILIYLGKFQTVFFNCSGYLYVNWEVNFLNRLYEQIIK